MTTDKTTDPVLAVLEQAGRWYVRNNYDGVEIVDAASGRVAAVAVKHDGRAVPATFDAAAIVRAVNTFAQAREALRAVTKCFGDDGFSNPIGLRAVKVIGLAEAALAAMDGQP